MKNKISMPPLPLKGSCQCGAVRYLLKGKPLAFYICHCKECQKQSSSAFGESLRVRIADLEIRGKVKSFVRGSNSGTKVHCDFCPNCGTRLFHRRPTNKDSLNIKAGTLDDSSWLKPAGHIWTKSRQSWVIIPQDDLSYEGQPNDYDELINRWQKLV